MAVTINDFSQMSVGDIITLSDLQTQKEYDALSADFKVKEVRFYDEPNGLFNHIAVICNYENKDKGAEGQDQSIMVLARNFKTVNEFDIFVYYLDMEGEISGAAEHILNEDGQDLKNRIEVTVYFDDGEVDVTWDKKSLGTVFGVETSIFQTEHREEVIQDNKTIVEYVTNDDMHGNQNAFIEWTGDSVDGWFELWYGCQITPNDVELYDIK